MARGGSDQQRPLIVRRVVEGGHGGHHGGAWKVAYADFVTAMMAFFLLLWLISSASEDTLKGLSEYFNEVEPVIGPPGGAGGLLEGQTLLPHDQAPAVPPGPPMAPLRLLAGQAAAIQDSAVEPGGPEAALPGGLSELEAVSDARLEAERERREAALFDRAKATITAALDASPELRPFADNLMVDRTPEGLRIQIVDGDQSPMFPVGSDRMYPHTRRLLALVTEAIAGLPNRVSIRGHTDSLPFAPGAAYDNWRLSSDRANVTREVLVELGLKPERVAEVTGKADAESLIPESPGDPRNRRISLVLLHMAATGPPAEQDARGQRPAAAEKPRPRIALPALVGG